MLPVKRNPRVYFSDESQGFQKKEPSCQGKGAEKGGNHNDAGSQGSFVAHVFCHDKTAYGGGGPQHYQDSYKSLLPESEENGQGQKHGAEYDKL